MKIRSKNLDWSSQLSEKKFLSPRSLNSHALTHISDRALLLYQVRVLIEMLYLGWSNPLQGQVLERPQQHVEPQPMQVRERWGLSIGITHYLLGLRCPLISLYWLLYLVGLYVNCSLVMSIFTFFWVPSVSFFEFSQKNTEWPPYEAGVILNFTKFRSCFFFWRPLGRHHLEATEAVKV